MQSDIAPEVESEMATDTSTTTVTKSNVKVPKRVHKSQREKMKREHLNEQFLSLANTLGLSEESSCKASVLNEATRLVKESVDQIKCLKQLNDTLLAESVYVTAETNELKDDNSALEAEIGKLRIEIKSRLSDMDLNEAPPENQNQKLPTHSGENLVMFTPELGQLQGQMLNPVHFSTLCSNVPAYAGLGTNQLSFGHASAVSKPHARYPNPTDTWPSQILEKEPELGKTAQDGYRNSHRCAQV